MKRIIFVLIFIGALMPLIAQEGVKFENLTLKEALNKAEKIDKQVFVDCYTSWCGPCKNMTENIFPQKVVGDYFNVNFVCVKYDMEKGEGPEIAKQYEIRAYPTFLILNPDGTLVHKIVGGRDAKGIIRSAMEAMDENKATGKMDEKYKAGERGKEFLVAYLNTLLRFYDPKAREVADELLARLSKKEKVSQEYWSIFTNPDLSPAGSRNECYLLENYKRFCKSLGKEAVAKELERRYADSLMDVFSRSSLNNEQLCLLSNEIRSFDLPHDGELQAYIRIAQASLEGVEELVAVCDQDFPQIRTLEFPYIQFFDRVMNQASDSGKKTWLAIGERYVERMDDGDKLKGFIKTCVELYRKKLFGGED